MKNTAGTSADGGCRTVHAADTTQHKRVTLPDRCLLADRDGITEAVDDGFPRSKSDPALRNVWANLWFHYSDVREHTLTGKHALTPEARALYERSLLFLKSDLEFQWPPTEFKPRYGLLRLLGVEKTLKQREEKDMSVGDKEFWPFLKEADYEEAALAKSQTIT